MSTTKKTITNSITNSGCVLSYDPNIVNVIATYAQSFYKECCMCDKKLYNLECITNFNNNVFNDENGNVLYYYSLYDGLKDKYLVYDRMCITCIDCIHNLECSNCSKQYYNDGDIIECNSCENFYGDCCSSGINCMCWNCYKYGTPAPMEICTEE